MKLIKIGPSSQKEKRLMAVFQNGDREKTVHFGLRGGSTYIDHKSKEKRDAYIARHHVNENFNKPDTAGALAKNILWGPSTSLRENIKAFKSKFKL